MGAAFRRPRLMEIAMKGFLWVAAAATFASILLLVSPTELRADDGQQVTILIPGNGTAPPQVATASTCALNQQGSCGVAQSQAQGSCGQSATRTRVFSGLRDRGFPLIQAFRERRSTRLGGCR